MLVFVMGNPNRFRSFLNAQSGNFAYLFVLSCRVHSGLFLRHVLNSPARLTVFFLRYFLSRRLTCAALSCFHFTEYALTRSEFLRFQARAYSSAFSALSRNHFLRSKLIITIHVFHNLASLPPMISAGCVRPRKRLPR